jgi:hypothetical protein
MRERKAIVIKAGKLFPALFISLDFRSSEKRFAFQ